MTSGASGRRAVEINRRFYDALWAGSRLIPPERFNTWPLVRDLSVAGSRRLEIGAGLRPRLPIPGTCFVEISGAALAQLSRHGGLTACATAASLPYPDAGFDLVMAMDIVEHLDDDAAVFAELARVLRPGGLLVLSSPLHPEGWTSFDDVVGHVRRYRPVELLESLAAHGLFLERSAVYGMQPRSRLLSRMGAWFLTRQPERAFYWYNRVLPIGLRLQKPLRLVAGMIDATGVDEVLLVCRRQVS